jgi:hypothetical protein
MSWIIEGGKSYNVSVKPNGDKFYYLNNKLHRELGPAIELKESGSKAWYFQGEKVACSSQKEFEKVIGLKKEAAVEKWFDIRTEALIPATIYYKVQAKSAEEAASKIKNATPKNIQYKPAGKREKKLIVYDAGTTTVRLTKNLSG